MFELIHLNNKDDIMAEGRTMHNALENDGFTTQLIGRGTEVYTLRTSHGESVANISIDAGIVTNIVGPYNAPIPATLLAVLSEKVKGLGTIREGHTHGHVAL